MNKLALVIALGLAVWGVTSPLDGTNLARLAALAIGIIWAARILTAKKETK